MAHWLDEVINKVLHAAEGTQGSLHQQLAAFRETLHPTITAAEFADMDAQTIVYGLFAARVADANQPTFSRYDAARSIPKTNPFLRKMLQQIAGYDLDERIAWLVDDCAHVLQRTDMAEVLRTFGTATKQEDPVVNFYETFLATYDPKMREMRGVYYTPEPVVSYMVRSVDLLLQTRFGKATGLADGDTLVLDPATGTATFILHNPADQGVRKHGITTAPVETVAYHAQQQRVSIGTGMYVEGVEPETWTMQIGGYQPLQKWLKDRKGRTLSFQDALHYMRMVVALRETRRVMTEIDATLPEWPVA